MIIHPREYGDAVGRNVRPGLALRQKRNAPGDPLAAMNEGQRTRCSGGQFFLDQRKMGAGQRHGIHAVPARLVGQARQRGAGDRRVWTTEEDEATQKRLANLRELLNGRMLRRLKDDVLKGVIKAKKELVVRVAKRGGHKK